jgi:hypothetical protein
VDDAAPMSGGKRVRRGNRDPEHVADTHAVPRNEGIEALTGHVLHHDEVIAPSRFDFVNGDDVRVIECRGGLRLLDEPPTAILIRQTVGGQYLDRHFAA